MISSKTRVFAVIGWPIEHTLSPVLHNWFLSLYALDAIYVAFSVADGDLDAAIKGAVACGIAGLNVTIPHKERVVRLADETDRDVQLISAANTLKLDNKTVQAFVTDPYGFVASLKQKASEFNNASVLLLGAGGAAKSVASALQKLSPAKVFIYNRSIQRRNAFMRYCKKTLSLSSAESVAATHLDDIAAACNIIINTTSVGMYPNMERSLLSPAAFNSNHFVYDLIYNPQKTKLLNDADKNGATIQNGIDMLIFQGLASLRIWTDLDLNINDSQLADIRNLLLSRLTC